MVEDAIITPEWLPIEDVCTLMNRAEKTIKDKCHNAELVSASYQFSVFMTFR